MCYNKLEAGPRKSIDSSPSENGILFMTNANEIAKITKFLSIKC